MGEVIKIEHFQLCMVCRKKQATLLCDMPTGRMKNLHITKIKKLKDGSFAKITDYENSFKEFTLTCDNPICEKCAIEVGGDIHFCKRCYNKLVKSRS